MSSGENDAYVGTWVFPACDDALEMVGRKGSHDIAWLAAYIAEKLSIDSGDTIVDLCCGNGLITEEIAKTASFVVGVDYSRVLLQQARDRSTATNVSYLEGDAVKLSSLLDGRLFDKALLVAAFQYFDPEAARHVLAELHGVLKPGARAAIFDIPDRALKLHHYIVALRRLIAIRKKASTEKSAVGGRFQTMGARWHYLARNFAHAVGLKAGSSELGWWWGRTEFEELAKSSGFKCMTLSQPSKNPHHTYRFDAILTKSA